MSHQKCGAGEGERRGEEDKVGEDLGTWGKRNRRATCLQVVSQSSSQHPQHTPQSGHPCNNRAATGERDKERQTNRRKKERKQRVSNTIGRYDCMMSPSSVASLRVIAIFVLLLPSGWLQNTKKATPGTGQAYICNYTFKKRKEASHFPLKHKHFCHCGRNVSWKILQRMEGA